MPGRAAGLRANPSQAADATLPCPNAARAAANAIAKPEVMATQFVPPEAAASLPCAKAGIANSDTTTRVKISITTFRIVVLLRSFRQEVVDAILVQTPSHW